MTIGPRLISALALTAIMGFLYWMVPNFEPATVGATTPDRIALFFTGLFALFWIYLVVQGYPISHGHIGTSSTHNLDNIISGIPAIAALFGIFLHLVGFSWRVSFVNLVLAAMTMAVVVYELWIIGGAASKINRLTQGRAVGMVGWKSRCAGCPTMLLRHRTHRHLEERRSRERRCRMSAQRSIISSSDAVLKRMLPCDGQILMGVSGFPSPHR